MATPHPTPVADAALVLLVEDEVDLRDIIELLLVMRGYRVLTAGDGIEALKLFKEYGRTLSVVLTDLRLPRLDGLPMLRAIRKVDPNIPFVVVSGTIADWPPSRRRWNPKSGKQEGSWHQASSRALSCCMAG